MGTENETSKERNCGKTGEIKIGDREGDFKKSPGIIVEPKSAKRARKVDR